MRVNSLAALAAFGWCALETLACNRALAPDRSTAAPPDTASTVAVAPQAGTGLLARARSRFGPLETSPAVLPAQAALGRRLFFETRMSADGQIGCVSCHLPERWGSDGQPLPKGVFGRENPRNAPTVFNASAQGAEHWRADRESVEDQARRALLGPVSFGLASDEDATQRLRAMTDYAADFRIAFPDDPDPISVKNWGAAIGAFERTLVTPAPFDAWLAGSETAIDPKAREGLGSFLDVGCTRCHDGALLGGQKLRKFGISQEYWQRTRSAKIDAGRFDVTHDEKDRYVFKVPSLRNVARTAPYFHDGSVASLPEAVASMAELELGRALGAEDVGKIVAFLETLTGAVPSTYSAPTAAGVR
jgi:cytochrome c peroxidase